MINIYSESISNRLIYTLNVIFKHILKIEYTLVNLETFHSSNNIKINYSSKRLENCISIVPHSILFEKKINKHQIIVDWTNEIPYFFKTSENSTFNHDIFASTFFMISRYEEYNPIRLDIHNRFRAENSIAFKNNFLELPVVNLWAKKLQDEILNQKPNFTFPAYKYRYINSIDIDIAYAYKGKSILRLLGSSIKSLLTLNKNDLTNRLNYIFKNKDIYDTYSFLNKIQEKYKTQNFYFINLGNYAKFDKNLSFKNRILYNLIKNIDSNENNTFGIHPSYASNTNSEKIKIEKKRLEKIVNKKIQHSRQHYLILNFPNTYENLIANGIEHDFSMGYSSKIGFRAGICTTYPFFNVLKNKEEKLLVTPFQIMDGTLNQYEKLTAKEAIKKTVKITDEIKKVNGTFVSLWHNSSLSEVKEWKDWSKVYTKLVDCAKE